ncbi:MAG TPA: HEAT repeat domain-containing protein [Planctomycetaceae bacterium]|nr:HEAT repeat domain-containing protein [Planctomycetaceae bacterium]
MAHLIYKSQTACYAKDRRNALDKLGDRYSCVCNPEIMCALVYGLNDCDERVRREAADEIGDQLRKNPCCCSAEVTAALTAALGDCDKGVRRQAEEALRACGYEIVDGCCDKGCCDKGCGDKGCGKTSCGKTSCGANACGASGATPMAAPAPAPEAKDAAPAPAPAPPEEPKAYFPTRLNDQQTTKKAMKSKLANLFGLRS